MADVTPVGTGACKKKFSLPALDSRQDNTFLSHQTQRKISIHLNK
jgi:hypothetical protein